MKIDWEQSGMPVPLVTRLGPRNEFAEFKSVLREARDQVMTPVDAEAMARELVQSGGREYVEMVRELTTALANAKRELEAANRRYERLTAELAGRGVSIDEDPPRQPGAARSDGAAAPDLPERESASPADEWEAWDRKFQSLLG